MGDLLDAIALGHLSHCLGVAPARVAAQIAFKTLFDRNPNLRLAVAPDTLKIAGVLSIHGYECLPVLLD